MTLSSILRAAQRRTQLTATMGVLVLCGQITQAFLIGFALDSVLRGETLNASFLLTFATLLILRALLVAVGRLVGVQAAAHAKIAIRKALFQKMMTRGPASLADSRTGEIVNESVENLEALDVHYGLYLPQFYVSIFSPLILCSAVAWLDWKTALVLLISAPMAPLLLGLMQSRFRSVTQRYYASANRLSARFLDSLQGLLTLKMFNRSKAHGEAIRDECEQLRRETMHLLALNQLVILIMDWGFSLGAVTVAFVTAGFRWHAGALSPGGAITILLLSVELVRQFNLIGAFIFAGAMGRRVLGKIKEILDTPQPAFDSSSEAAVRLECSQPPVISFHGVTFPHSPELSPVLKSVTMTVRAGEFTALTGPSGEGKSTLLHLLSRFVEPTQGFITFDGKRIDHFSPHVAREAIALVAQDNYLFHGSIIDNLRLGNPFASHEEMVEMLKRVGLHAFITQLPRGYHTVIGERAVDLSGGQRQRLALARALIKRAPILLLDEVTAHVDPVSAAALHEVIAQLTREKTIIAVTHDAELLRCADRILRLDRGMIYDDGAKRLQERAA